MREKIIYIADDGEEFEDKPECLAHERRLQVDAFDDHLRLWDEDMKPLDPAEEDALEDAYFIYADTPEAREWVEAGLNIYCELGWDTVYVGYIYDEWRDLSAEFSRLGKMLHDMTM
jgi:hypothetical protein